MPAENQDPSSPDASPAPGRALRSREEQMPGWTSTLGEINRLYKAGKVSEAQARMKNLLGDLLTNDLTVDTNTGQIRDMTWWERNGDVTLFLAQAAAAMVAGIYLSGANASTPGVGNAPQTAPAPASTVPAAPGAAPAAGAPAAAVPAAAAPAASSLPAAAGPAAAGPAAASAPVYLTDVAEPAAGILGSGIPWGDVIRYGAAQGLNYLGNQQYTNALNQASQAEIDAINRAIDLQSRIYDTTRTDVNQARGGYKPYQALGQEVLPNLYKMVGLTPPSGAAGVAPTGLTNAGAQGQGLNGPNSVPGRRFGTEPVGPGTSLTGVGSTDHSYQTGSGLTGGTPAAANGAMVTVQGPDGSTRRVPYEQAAFYESRGGRIIA